MIKRLSHSNFFPTNEGKKSDLDDLIIEQVDTPATHREERCSCPGCHSSCYSCNDQCSVACNGATSDADETDTDLEPTNSPNPINPRQ